MWLIRNKKTGLPAGEVDQATKEAMESSGEYAGILSFEAITPKAKAPRPELVKPIELTEEKPKARRTRKTSVKNE